MFYLLRIIRTNRWIAAQKSATWLQPGEIIADTMADFTTIEGKISLYRVNLDLSNLARIVAALAVNRDNPDHFDYCTINFDTLTHAGFKLGQTPGKTRDEEVNSLHYDLIELTTQRLLELTHLFFHHNEELTRITQKKVIQYVLDNRDNINLNKISKKWSDILLS